MLRGRDLYGPGFWKGGPGRTGTWAGGWFGGGFRGMACRLYPWLPRRWWALAPVAAGAALAAWMPWGQTNAVEDEAGLLRSQAEALRAQLGNVERRLAEIDERTKEEKN